MINTLIVLMLYALVFIGSEIAYGKFHVSFLASKKMAHISGSIVSLFLPYFMSNIMAVCVGIFFTLVIFISKNKHIFKSIHDQKRNSLGEVVFPLGIALSALIVWPLSIIAYQGSCLVLGLSDGLAGYIGNKYGKRNYPMIAGSKTVEGSIIFFFFTSVIFCVYYFLYATHASVFGVTSLFLYAMIMTFIEAMFSSGWDNLIIPITAGLTLLLITI